ncbi:MAG: putative CsbD stress protein [Modestobacter sp.]|jgi:uncharacterized protein YjbJ (UPF0337 family)|nr:putative CsbD stress protein [Modestobacter sp.]
MINLVNLLKSPGVRLRRPGYCLVRRQRTKEDDVSGIDKMKDKAQELAGEGKEAAGKATDDRDLQAEGHKDQAAGNAKQAGEKVKDIFK